MALELSSVRRALALLALAGLAVGCAGSETPPPKAALAPADLEDLRREVAELRLQLASDRRVAVSQAQLVGLRQEVQAIQRAVQALVRDVDQRNQEAMQALERRVAAVARRLDEAAAAARPAEPVTTAPAAPPTSPAEPLREPTPAAPAGQLITLRRVRPSVGAGETRVTIETDGPITPRVFTLADPPRLVLDFENAAFGFERAPVAVEGAVVERIRFIQLRAMPTPMIRMLLGLREAAPYWIEPQPRGLVVHVGTEAPRRSP